MNTWKSTPACSMSKPLSEPSSSHHRTNAAVSSSYTLSFITCVHSMYYIRSNMSRWSSKWNQPVGGVKQLHQVSVNHLHLMKRIDMMTQRRQGLDTWPSCPTPGCSPTAGARVARLLFILPLDVLSPRQPGNEWASYSTPTLISSETKSGYVNPYQQYLLGCVNNISVQLMISDYFS